MDRFARGDVLVTALAALMSLEAAPAAAQTAPDGTLGPPFTSAVPGRVVLERLEGGILTIGIDRQEVRNRLDPALFLALGKAFYRIDAADDLRVGVLYGRGPDFVAGLDVPQFRAGLAAGTFPPSDPEWILPLNLARRQRTKPLVVAAHGATAFVGHELFLAADVRVASRTARFAQGEVQRGVFPAGGATVRFAREAGWANAMRYMLTGDGWDAAEAYRMGLVQTVTAPGHELAAAIDIARKIAAAAPLGVRATLASANRGLAAEELAAYAALQPEFGRILATRDAAEGARAAAEGRLPQFSGR
jgi:enoyl-CoA hydratase/carnithine racemase